MLIKGWGLPAWVRRRGFERLRALAAAWVRRRGFERLRALAAAAAWGLRRGFERLRALAAAAALVRRRGFESGSSLSSGGGVSAPAVSSARSPVFVSRLRALTDAENGFEPYSQTKKHNSAGRPGQALEPAHFS